MTTPPRFSIVSVVEGGSMERQALMLAESRAAFGGASARWPWLMVAPRRHCQPHRSTISRLEKLGVEFVRPQRWSDLPWFPIYNKLVAIREAERRLGSGMCWYLDTDTLFGGDLSLLGDCDGLDLLATNPHMSGASTVGRGPNYSYWRHASTVLKVDLESLARVDSFDTGEQIYQYWNNGVFVFRLGAGFPAQFASDFKSLFFSMVKSPVAGLYHTSQVTMPFTVAKCNLRVGVLPEQFHHTMSHAAITSKERHELPPSVIHYFGSMWPEHFPTFVERVRKVSPDLAGFVERSGPLYVPRSYLWRAKARYLKSAYGSRLKRHVERSRTA